MPMVKMAAIFMAVCCVIYVPCIFQTIGFLTPMWASNETCDYIGLLYSCCTGSDNSTCGNTNGYYELDPKAFTLHLFSMCSFFMVVYLSSISICVICCCPTEGNKSYFGMVCGSCCTVLLYILAGVFSLVGCSSFADKFDTTQFGYSYYLCLTAGCLVIIATIAPPLFVITIKLGSITKSSVGVQDQNQIVSGDNNTITPGSSKNNTTEPGSNKNNMKESGSHKNIIRKVTYFGKDKTEIDSAVITRIKSYADAEGNKSDAMRSGAVMVHKPVGDKLDSNERVGRKKAQLTKPFTISGERSVTMSNKGENDFLNAKLTKERVEDLSLDEYIENGNDFVEECYDDGSDFLTVDTYRSGSKGSKLKKQTSKREVIPKSSYAARPNIRSTDPKRSDIQFRQFNSTHTDTQNLPLQFV